MATCGNSVSTAWATALTKWSMVPACEPSFSSMAAQLGHWQGFRQSFCETEAMVALGLARSFSLRFLMNSSRISGLVRQSWARWWVRFPSMRLYHSGCLSKYVSGGRMG